MGDTHTHGGDCCSDCAAARTRGLETPCERARRLGEVAQCDGGACAAPAAARSTAGCMSCATPLPDDVGQYVPPALAWQAQLAGPAGDAARRQIERRTGRAVARRTGAINLERPPISAATEAAYAAAIATTATAGRLGNWAMPQRGEDAAETAARLAVFRATLRRDGETDAAYRERLRLVGVRATASQREWILGMSVAGYLPGYLADFAFGPAPTTNTLPPAPPPPAPAGAGSGAGSAGTAAGGTGTAPQNPTPAQWLTFVGGLLSAAATTTVALVNGARESDRQAREQAARDEAARLAREDDDAGRTSVGVEAAERAYQNARTAALHLGNADRVQATAKLSEAQGNLVGAVAAQGYFAGRGARIVPPVLAQAIRRAQTEVDRVAGLIERSPLPPPVPTPTNPLAPEFPPASGWGALSTPAKVGVVAAAAGALALLLKAVAK